MDEFLKIVCMSQLGDSEKGDAFIKHFAPFMDRLKSLLSESLYLELEELFTDCCVENNEFYATEGAKLAIEIMNGSYIPKI